MKHHPNEGAPPVSEGKRVKGVRKTLLTGVLWRILIIEGILLLWSLLYRAIVEGGGPADLFWFSLRIILLIGIIILFLMVTLRTFLSRTIIRPLETIASANRRLLDDKDDARDVSLPEGTPREIKEIASSRKRMLDTIIKVSEERLRLVTFIRDTFGRYLSKRAVDEILESPEGQKIGGHRATVTVLLSDLRGFTSLTENRDPEEMVQHLNRYLESMSRVILAYGGMIDDFIGDAILVVFGVPEKGDDDPFRAVACALAMQNALAELNEETVRDGYPPLEMGIGLNTGTVIVGNIGSEVRMKYGIVGTTMNMAARIESNTIGGQVLIGENTYEIVKDQVTATPPQTAMMKGFKIPLVMYPVTAIGAPYNVALERRAGRDGVEINLPFQFWKLKGKRIGNEAMAGETVMLQEDIITASVDPPLDPLTDIKLIFNFCMDAHCFEDIYAKVVSVDSRDGKTTHRLRITSVSSKDREVLKKWITEAS
jgi:class 3 adenylate cyclase